MTSSVAKQQIEVHSPLSREGRIGFLVRWVCVVLLVDLGFAALSVFGAAERVPPANITFNQEMGPYILSVALACLYPWALVVLICELAAYLMLSKGWSWNIVQIILAVCMGIAGAAFAQHLFAPFQDSVKGVLVTGGGALVAFLAGGLHFALFELSIDSLPNTTNFPMWWLVALVLIGTTFIGALHQWTSYDPRFRQLILYKDQRAREKGWQGPRDLTPMPDDIQFAPVAPRM